MNQNLETSEVGTIYFTLKTAQGEHYYICSSLSLSLQLNSIPTASVVIGCGASLRDGHLYGENADNNAEDILTYVMDARNNNVDSFLDCEIAEGIVRGTELISTTIFKGCVVSASLVYKAGNVTMRAVRVECMNSACKLYAQPLSAFNHTVGSYIVEALTYRENREHLPDQQKTIATYGMNSVGSLTTQDVCKLTKYITQHKDMATKIAYLADAIAILSTKVVNTAKPEEIIQKLEADVLKVKRYLKSDYYINYKELAINDVTDASFDESLCDRLLDGMRSSSIFESILRSIVSSEFLLTLVPKWIDDDFMLSIEPSHAWESTPAYTLKFSQIAEFNSAYRPFDHINDPEIFAVNFSTAINFSGNKGQVGKPSTIVGAYSTNSEVAEWLKERFNNSESEDQLRTKLTGDLTNFKWNLITAPSWLHVSFVSPKEDSKTQSEIESQRTQQKEESEDEMATTESESAVIYDYQKGHEIADRVAKALYIHLHGESATAHITVLPNMRFGLFDGTPLEACLGRVIDIVPDEETDQHLAMRGMLEMIQFNYNAGQSATCSYSIWLSRVRPLKQNAEDIKSPMYVTTPSE